MNAIVIDINGDICYKNIENISKDILYKSCGYKKNIKFKLIETVNIANDEKLELWGKTGGRDSNKFLFSMKFKEIKISGKCVLIHCDKEGKNILNINDDHLKAITFVDDNTIQENINDKTSKNNAENDEIDYNSELEPEEYLYSSEE